LDVVGQGVHEAPQLAMLALLAQVLPHRCVPGLHENPHELPSHVAVASDGGTHGEHEVPQVAVLESAPQMLPQAW
jgi:hypothetical protein